MELRAVIFDLDGVITDTAEYHYRAWQRLADEEGLPFDRAMNEQLRGVSRRASLDVILAGRQYDEARIAEMMERKNAYYVAMLEQVSPADLLPGAVPLLRELRAAGIKTAIGSASKNAQTVLEALEIRDLMDAVADGYSVERTKPAPDLFLKAAEMLGVPPAAAAVVEDAAAGIDAALAGGMWAVGLGPAARVGHAHVRFESLDGVTLADLQAGIEAAAWTVAEPAFDPAGLNHMGTVFTTGNGHLCVRGDFEEGYPGAEAACFIHRLWDDMPVQMTELANVPRWWGVDLWVNGIRFRMDRGTLMEYRRWLDLRTGVLARRVRWQPATGGPVVEIEFTRCVSRAQPRLAATRVRVTAVTGEADVRLRTGLDAYVENTGLLHWRLLHQAQSADTLALEAQTRATHHNLGLAAALATNGSAAWSEALSDADGQPAAERRGRLEPGQWLAVDKFVGFASDSDEARPAGSAAGGAGSGEDVLAVAGQIATEARAAGLTALLDANAAAWRLVWDSSDVVVEGDHEAQIALRFNLFQLLIAGPVTTDRASIGAKTLSGFGYRHHVFWDTEIFMLPFFTFTQPELARNMLMYRWHNLPGARAKAAGNGYEGAQFPWESAGDGIEVTPTWVTDPQDSGRQIRIWTGDIEIHITADIAYAVMQFWRVTGDDAWMADYGAEIVLDGARFWASAARLEDDGRYHFRNVIGPDEYHDRIDDNTYTNRMAQWHLETALAVLSWLERSAPEAYQRLAAALDLSAARLAQWRTVAARIYLPAGYADGLIEQFAGYFGLRDVPEAELRDPQRTASLQQILGLEGVAETQVLKQPDVLMLQYLLWEGFSPEQVLVNYGYYSPRTDHEYGSSLGPSISAIMAARVGDDAAAAEHFRRAARADLQDVRGNAGDGIHGASAGGLWQAAVLGFGGLRIHDDGWDTQPRLPAGWTRLAFKFYHKGKLQHVEIEPGPNR